jgi:hypothetical protein
VAGDQVLLNKHRQRRDSCIGMIIIAINVKNALYHTQSDVVRSDHFVLDSQF